MRNTTFIKLKTTCYPTEAADSKNVNEMLKLCLICNDDIPELMKIYQFACLLICSFFLSLFVYSFTCLFVYRLSI